mgnify:CR=1 FL=1
MGVDIPFVINGGKKNNNKKDQTFQLFDSEQLDINFKFNNLSLLSMIDKITQKQDQTTNNQFMKGSETEEYYKELKLKSKSKSKSK